MFLSGTNDAEVNMRKTILKDGSGAEDVFDAMERYVRAVEEHLKRISDFGFRLPAGKAGISDFGKEEVGAGLEIDHTDSFWF